jgi:hypothetical protein
VTHSRAMHPSSTECFDRRLFVDAIALLALLGTPAVLVVAAVAHRPYILIALALVIPALAAVPVALERRHHARSALSVGAVTPRRGTGPSAAPVVAEVRPGSRYGGRAGTAHGRIGHGVR